MAPDPGKSTLPAESSASGNVREYVPEDNEPIHAVDWALILVSRGGYNFERCATVVYGKLELEDAVAALYTTKGNVAEAARLLHVGRYKLQAMIDNKPDLRDLLDDVRETFLDRIEASVFERAAGGDFQAQKFILTSLGKRRGWGQQVTIEQDVSDKLLAAMNAANSRGHALPGPIVDVQ